MLMKKGNMTEAVAAVSFFSFYYFYFWAVPAAR
jgi:hypothetical protein